MAAGWGSRSDRGGRACGLGYFLSLFSFLYRFGADLGEDCGLNSQKRRDLSAKKHDVRPEAVAGLLVGKD